MAWQLITNAVKLLISISRFYSAQAKDVHIANITKAVFLVMCDPSLNEL
jgi:hypothetical protein